MATQGSKVRVPTRELTLAHTLDVDGQPVMVVIRRVPLSRIASIFKTAPAFIESMVGTGESTEPVPSPETAMSRIDRTQQYYATAEAVVIASCIKPRFYKDAPPEGVDLTAPDCEWADVDALAETDKGDIMREALELAGYYPSDGEAKEVATFPAG
jgi:hypothetical protein